MTERTRPEERRGSGWGQGRGASRRIGAVSARGRPETRRGFGAVQPGEIGRGSGRGQGAGETGDKAWFWRGGGWGQWREVGAVETGESARFRPENRRGIGSM